MEDKNRTFQLVPRTLHAGLKRTTGSHKAESRLAERLFWKNLLVVARGPWLSLNNLQNPVFRELTACSEGPGGGARDNKDQGRAGLVGLWAGCSPSPWQGALWKCKRPFKNVRQSAREFILYIQRSRSPKCPTLSHSYPDLARKARGLEDQKLSCG